MRMIHAGTIRLIAQKEAIGASLQSAIQSKVLALTITSLQGEIKGSPTTSSHKTSGSLSAPTKKQRRAPCSKRDACKPLAKVMAQFRLTIMPIALVPVPKELAQRPQKQDTYPALLFERSKVGRGASTPPSVIEYARSPKTIPPNSGVSRESDDSTPGAKDTAGGVNSPRVELHS